MDDSIAAAGWRGDQWFVREAFFPSGSRIRCPSVLRRGVCDGVVGGLAIRILSDSPYRSFGDLDSRWEFSSRFRLLSRSTLAGDVADCHRSGFPHPHLFGRIHVGGGRFLPVLLVPEFIYVFHADAGVGRQLSSDVCGLGGSRPGVVSPDRFLVHERLRCFSRQKSIHRKPDRRLRISHRPLPFNSAFRISRFLNRLS